MEITVKTIGQKSYVYSLEKDSKLSDLKNKIKVDNSIKSDNFKIILIFKGSVLKNDDKLLCDYGITNKSSVVMILKKKPNLAIDTKSNMRHETTLDRTEQNRIDNVSPITSSSLQNALSMLSSPLSRPYAPIPNMRTNSQFNINLPTDLPSRWNVTRVDTLEENNINGDAITPTTTPTLTTPTLTTPTLTTPTTTPTLTTPTPILTTPTPTLTTPPSNTNTLTSDGILDAFTQQLSNNPQQFIQILGQNPEMRRIMQEHPQEISQILNDPNFISDVLSIGASMAQDIAPEGEFNSPLNRTQVTQLNFTKKEADEIDMLISFGFDKTEVIQCYLACDKNIDRAANVLMDK